MEEGSSGSGARGIARVAAVVRAAHRARSGVRLTESVLLGGAAVLITLGAAVLSGALLPAALPAGALAGIAAGLSWWLEHARSPARSAGDLDRRLRFDGALDTAWEASQGGAPSRLAAALGERVAARLDGRAARRALLPSPALPVAVPLLSAALLALCLERASDPGLDESLRRLTADLSATLAQARAQSRAEGFEGQLEEQLVARLAGLERAAGVLDGEVGDAGLEPVEARAELAELERELAELGPQLARGSELAALVEEARTLADAAALGLAGHAFPGPDSGPGDGSGLAPGSGAELASGESDGRMVGPSAGQELPGAPAAAEDPGSQRPLEGRPGEGGAATARWWPARHDRLVEAWIESRRAALAPAAIPDPSPDEPHSEPREQ